MSKQVELTEEEIKLILSLINDVSSKAFRDRYITKKRNIPDEEFFMVIPIIQGLATKLNKIKDEPGN